MKRKIYKATVWSTLLYESETWKSYIFAPSKEAACAYDKPFKANIVCFMRRQNNQPKQLLYSQVKTGIDHYYDLKCGQEKKKQNKETLRNMTGSPKHWIAKYREQLFNRKHRAIILVNNKLQINDDK